jgi:hypothetical protein
MTDQIATHTWVRLAWITGLASVTCYFGAAFLPLPDVVGLLLAFAFGPLLSVSFLGLYRYLSGHREGPLLQVACLMGIIAGTMVTLMLVVQVGNNMVRVETLAAAESDSAREAAQLAWRAVNRVQYLIDVVWDIFICSATMLLGLVLWSHPHFGKIWGGLGTLAGLALLVLNLQTFPTAPAYAGSVDLGPVVALWVAAVFIRMIFLRK